MKRFLALLLLIPGAAQAQDFGAVPYNFVGGTPADASQAMANFQALVNGGNAAGAAIASALAAKQLIPSGAYMYFYLASCPAGWTRPAAYDLKFVRGLDNGAGRDTTGTGIGGFESNSVQDHTHSGTTTYVSSVTLGGFAGGGTSNFPVSSLNFTAPNPATSAATSGNRGSETRPMDMPLLLCQKN